MTLSRAVRFLITGPQGSGKGTQGALIAEAFHVPSISTGDVFRANINAGTELGKRVKSLVENGELVPDELTSALVRGRLVHPDAGHGFLLDGYPRSLGQVADLDLFLNSRGERLDAVIVLQIPTDESVRRLLLRAQVQGRTDDTAERISRRLEIYELETKPILASYREAGILTTVDGFGTVSDVTGRIFTALAGFGFAP